MHTPVRVGLLGLGQRGLQHLRALWRLQEEGLVRVVALADAFNANLDAAKIARFVQGYRPEGITLATDVEALVAARPRSPLDALYVSIPPNVHRGEVVRAARAGMHLFVEKPMSLFLDEAIAMHQAIAASGVLAAVGFQQRFDPRHEAIQHFLVGKRPVMATYTLHAPLEAHDVKHTPTDAVGGPANRVWTASRAWSGTTVVEAGIHQLDLWRWWFGDVAWVQAAYVERPPEEVLDGADNPYAYAVTFGFANGAVGNMILSRLRRVYRRESSHLVLWNEGHLRLEGDEVAAYHYDGPYPPEQPPEQASLRNSLPLPQAEEPTLAIARAFVRAIGEQNPSLIRSPFADAMNSLAAVIGANVSHALQGERVHLDALLHHDRYAAFRRRDGA